MPDVKTATDVYGQYGLYGLIAITFVVGVVWLVRHLLLRNQASQDQFLASLDRLGDKQAAALDKTVAQFREVAVDLGGRVDQLSAQVNSLECSQRPATNCRGN